MRIKYWISTSKTGSECGGEFEIEDDATEREIEEAAKDAAFEYLDWGYEKVPDASP